jgi:hypothetical protein
MHVEMRCKACGQLYIVQEADFGIEDRTTHAVTEAGEYCGGPGVPVGSWTEEVRTMEKKESRGDRRIRKLQETLKKDRERWEEQYTEYSLPYVREIVDAAMAEDPTQVPGKVWEQAMAMAQLEATNENNRLLARVCGRLEALASSRWQ